MAKQTQDLVDQVEETGDHLMDIRHRLLLHKLRDRMVVLQRELDEKRGTINKLLHKIQELEVREI